MNRERRAAVALVLSAAAAAGSASYLTPRQRLSEQLGPVRLNRSVPAELVEWTQRPGNTLQIINPQQEEALNRAYSDLLERSYIEKQGGYTVMLSIAYVEDQRGALSVHYPEVCYPSQGFQILSRYEELMDAGPSKIPVVRMLAQLGSVRSEPITYWIAVGRSAASSRFSKKLAELKYTALGRTIPDGLIFRVSSIDVDQENAYKRHASFIKSLLSAVPVATRHRLGMSA